MNQALTEALEDWRAIDLPKILAAPVHRDSTPAVDFREPVSIPPVFVDGVGEGAE